jgi:hypothetical protein
LPVSETWGKRTPWVFDFKSSRALGCGSSVLPIVTCAFILAVLQTKSVSIKKRFFLIDFNYLNVYNIVIYLPTTSPPTPLHKERGVAEYVLSLFLFS